VGYWVGILKWAAWDATEKVNMTTKQVQKEDTFVGCHCPKCEFPLKDTPVSVRHCPLCGDKMDPHLVWGTRKYEGVWELPFWVRAFGWPFLLMAAGVAYFVVPALYYNYYDVKLPSLIFAIGFVFFVAKLMVDDKRL
jgi:hypothetical protein